jgi:8-oxo-dGTP diphosphatase
MSNTLPRLGAAVLVVDGGRILLGERAKDPMRGAWVIPGGKILPFEPMSVAAKREVREETGLEIKILRQFGVYEIVDPPEEHRVIVYFVAKPCGGLLFPSDDISDVRFFSPVELGRVRISPLVAQVLRDAGFLPRLKRRRTTVVRHNAKSVLQTALPLEVTSVLGSTTNPVVSACYRLRQPSADGVIAPGEMRLGAL